MRFRPNMQEGVAMYSEEQTNMIVKNMITRRSVRSYLPQQIPEEALKTILKCGLYAPSGGNSQYARFIVVQDPALMEELNELIRKELAGREIVEGQWMNRGIIRARKENYHFIYHAPTLINAVSPRDHGNSMADCAGCLQNMQLAAWAQNLGACWSNQPHWLTDVPEIRAFFKRCGLRDEEDIFGSISVGYPAVYPSTIPARKGGRILLDTAGEAISL